MNCSSIQQFILTVTCDAVKTMHETLYSKQPTKGKLHVLAIYISYQQIPTEVLSLSTDVDLQLRQQRKVH